MTEWVSSPSLMHRSQAGGGGGGGGRAGGVSSPSLMHRSQAGGGGGGGVAGPGELQAIKAAARYVCILDR